MKEYDVTISKTGGIIVKADDAENAEHLVNNMSDEEIEEKIKWSEWATSDVFEVEKPWLYYSIDLNDGSKCLFRSKNVLRSETEIADYAARENLIPSVECCKACSKVQEEVYRNTLFAYFSEKIYTEYEDFKKSMQFEPAEKILSQSGKCSFYEDMVYNFDEMDDEELNLSSIERLYRMERPLEYLYEERYCDIDFGTINDLQRDLFNGEAVDE